MQNAPEKEPCVFIDELAASTNESEATSNQRHPLTGEFIPVVHLAAGQPAGLPATQSVAASLAEEDEARERRIASQPSTRPIALHSVPEELQAKQRHLRLMKLPTARVPVADGDEDADEAHEEAGPQDQVATTPQVASEELAAPEATTLQVASAELAAPEEAAVDSDATEEFAAPEEEAVEGDASDNEASSEAFRTPDKLMRKKKTSGAEKDLLQELDLVKDPRDEAAPLSDQQIDEAIVSGHFLETALGVVI